jgi:hypothetical protein
LEVSEPNPLEPEKSEEAPARQDEFHAMWHTWTSDDIREEKFLLFFCFHLHPLAPKAMTGRFITQCLQIFNAQA